MVKDDQVRLLHMLDAAVKVSEFLRAKTRKELDDDLMAFAVVRALEIIGEAARQISEPTKERYPDVKWQEIAATRNRLIHGYFEVDLDIVWTIAARDLPLLIKQLEDIKKQAGIPDDPA